MKRYSSVVFPPSAVCCAVVLMSVFGMALSVAANQVPNPTVTASARAFNASFTAVNLFDSGTAEYATLSQGAVSAPFTTDPNDGTWAEFDFGSTVTLNQFVMVTRNNAVDVIGTSRLIVSDDATFDSSDTIFTFNNTSVNAAGIIENIGPVAGRYARWEVLSRTGSGLNLGSRQMYFLNIPAGDVLLPAPAVINSATPFNATFAAAFAANGNAGDGPNNEYASQGAGAGMFVDFDFGAGVSISGFDFWNRVVDRVTTFDLIFSDTPDFSFPIATLSFTADLNGNQVNSGVFAPVMARYVRFLTTGATGGNNTGMREIQFYTPAGQPPIISQPPQGGTRLVGDSFTFAISAGGDTPLFYQWWFETTLLSGATNSSLTLTNLQLSQSGNYTVVVSNSFGTATSAPAMLMVIDPPLDITSDLRGWFKMDDGVFLTATDSSGNANHGTLQGFVDDDSQWVEGRMDGGLRFNPLGSGVNEVVVVPDTGPFDFSAAPEFTLAAWIRGPAGQENGAGVIVRGVGGVGEQYAVDVFAGTYRLFVREAGGTALVAECPIGPNGSWQHVVAIYSRTLSRMKIFVNTAEVASVTPFTTGLLANSHDVSIGARQNTASVDYNLNLNAVMDDVRIYARALTPRDIAALYAVAPPTAPTIVQQPQDRFTGLGDSGGLTVIVDGTVPLSYQWRKGGVPILTATNATLTITNAQLSDDAQYDVVISNAQGGVTSLPAHLTVVPFLNLTAAPVQASSEFPGGYLAANAFDGLKLSTGPNTARWASAPSGAPHWIYVDLGRDLAIRRVTADFDPACPRDFFLRYRTEAQGVASDPNEWSVMAAVTGFSQGNSQGIDGPDVFFDFPTSRVDMPGNVAPAAVASIGTNIFVGRYLMLHITATEAGFAHVSVWEMQVDAVPAQARIQSIAIENNGVRLMFSGIPNHDYDVERAPSVDGPWGSITSVLTSDTGLGEYLDPSPLQPNAFYRLFSP
jgi:hypothetical protein